MDELSYRSDEPEHAGEQPPEGPSCEIATGTCVTACGDCDDGTTYDIGPDPCVPGDCDEGTFCNSDSGRCEEPTCGKVAAELVRTNVLFVVDRSCSVVNLPEFSAGWDYEHLQGDIKGALNDENDGWFNWGLMLFPEPNADTADECAQAKPQVPIGPDTKDAVIDELASGASTEAQCTDNSDFTTNISQSVAVVEQLVMAPASDELPPDYVVLMTDGKQYSCGGADADAATEEHLRNLVDGGVKTAVVGFGSPDTTILNAFAEAGDTDGYYSCYKLDLVMAQAPKSCKYTLANKPAPDQEIVLPAAAWSYDAVSNTIELSDPYCNPNGSTGPPAIEVEFVCPVPSAE